METLKWIQSKRTEILETAGKYGAFKVRIFGSVARGEAKADSDIDILVELEEGRSLLDLGGLLMDLQDLLGQEVNVLTENSLHWYIREKALKEAVLL
ncbi:MAG: nucleotidyltransferase family protein [candidate division Zixibacteria bacterium]|nr:nucleotidyltransferase family protein [Candidatus Tariuqbacter arcticus]